MIISHRYRFIFIKTHKTAGSSMEMALAPHCGPDDIITPMESNRDSDIPRNFHEDTRLARAYASSRWVRKCVGRHSPLLGKWFYEHMPASRVRELVDPEIWRSYHKFCFERNPWAKVVSYHNWKRHGQQRHVPDFRDYVLRKTHRMPMDARLYFDGDTCLVDEVIDYSDFLNGFASVCKRLGIPYDGRMPREKTGVLQEKGGDYREYYDDETREKVASCFAREIALMRYTFSGTDSGAGKREPDGKKQPESITVRSGQTTRAVAPAACAGEFETYLINLDRATERMARMDRQLQALGISYTRIPAVDGANLSKPYPGFDEAGFRLRTGKQPNPWEIGCHLSHLSAFEAFLQGDARHALILEDDAQLPDDFVALLKQALDHAGCWNLLRLSSTREGRYITLSPLLNGRRLVVDTRVLKNTAAYLIDRRAAALCLERMRPM
ncbi:MAG TPA: glycosyltransferase family 25 protein, partial [Luteolibacter sp.]|nr:glycosyltransferase family 25 protein [Luteolibacter sp.]